MTEGVWKSDGLSGLSALGISQRRRPRAPTRRVGVAGLISAASKVTPRVLQVACSGTKDRYRLARTISVLTATAAVGSQERAAWPRGPSIKARGGNVRNRSVVLVTAAIAAVGMAGVAVSSGGPAPNVDRGLPTANLNNAAAGNRSNVAWSNGNDYVTGDTFVLGKPGQKWVVTRIRTWNIGHLNTPFGSEFSTDALYFSASAAAPGAIKVVEHGTVPVGSNRDTNRNIKHKKVTPTSAGPTTSRKPRAATGRSGRTTSRASTCRSREARHTISPSTAPVLLTPGSTTRRTRSCQVLRSRGRTACMSRGRRMR